LALSLRFLGGEYATGAGRAATGVANGLVAVERLAVPQAEQARARDAAEAIGLGMERLRLGQRPRFGSAGFKCLCEEEFPSHVHKLSTGL